MRAFVKYALRRQNGEETEIKRTEYSYEDSTLVNRVTVSVTDLGATSARVTVEETYGEAAENKYSRGRTRLKKDINGIETFYTYEDTTEYGAKWKKTMVTQSDGCIIRDRSRKTVSFIAENETVIREEQYVSMDRQWGLVSTAGYEYDDQKRVTKTIRGNGRVSTSKWGCCGPLEEVDEDGVKLSYGYSASRQLVEIIRSATEATPETIISYTRDAMGRVLEKRVDIGSLTKISRSSYDLTGRMISQTDELGRVTAYSYSGNGLTTTVTTPAGATLITQKHPNGSVLEQGGTGQRHLTYKTEITTEGIRVTENSVLRGQECPIGVTYINSFGENLLTGKVNTLGDFIYERSVYNTKGQLVQKGISGMAPILYEYDAFGYLMKETVKLAANPVLANSRITTYAYAFDVENNDIYARVTATKNNGQGATYRETSKKLISLLSSVLESKTIEIDPRGHETVRWTEYNGPCGRKIKWSAPVSTITAVREEVDGVMIREIDLAGVTLHTPASSAQQALDCKKPIPEATQFLPITISLVGQKRLPTPQATLQRQSMILRRGNPLVLLMPAVKPPVMPMI